MKRIGILCVFALLFSVCKASPVDSNAVKSVDGIVNEMLRTASHKKGEVKNWEWFRNLCLPTAQFTALHHHKNGTQSVNTLTLEEFVRAISGNKERAFLEYELGKTVDEYNGIAQVFQSYQVKAGGIEEKGINSYQLVYHKERWWIASVIWTANRNGVEIPQKYLNKK